MKVTGSWNRNTILVITMTMNDKNMSTRFMAHLLKRTVVVGVGSEPT